MCIIKCHHGDETVNVPTIPPTSNNVDKSADSSALNDAAKVQITTMCKQTVTQKQRKFSPSTLFLDRLRIKIKIILLLLLWMP